MKFEGPRIVRNAAGFGNRVGVIDSQGEHTYRQLVEGAGAVASTLLGDTRSDLEEDRVAFMVPPSANYVKVQWGIWRAGGIAVPLCLSHPRRELEYVLDDSEPSHVVASPEYVDQLKLLAGQRSISLINLEEPTDMLRTMPTIGGSRRAMILYTSGTTGKPKGVVTTHDNIKAQIRSLVDSWGWSPHDRILLNLPLHHLHGILNVLSCALWVGGICEMVPRFDPGQTWRRLSSGELSVYMAVPTIYHRLIEFWENAKPEERLSRAADLRLMVSGSAALPIPVLDRWREITGHTLLERYGMTEIGMALSNPLHGERRPGFVGAPLPGVELRLVDDNSNTVVDDGTPGKIEVRGPTVFSEYWNKPEATMSAFTEDGWFKTGDMAVKEAGSFRILGRESVDIIKTGGEKVSALEIENVLLGHPEVEECAVVGVFDVEWGQRVVAAVVLGREGVDLDDLKAWCRQRLAPFKVPKEVVPVRSLPRNAMGKVQKPSVASMVTS